MIYKYPIDIMPEQVLTIKGLIRILDITYIDSFCHVWILKDEYVDEDRCIKIRMVRTGDIIKDEILLEWTYWKGIYVSSMQVYQVFVDMPHLIGRR